MNIMGEILPEIPVPSYLQADQLTKLQKHTKAKLIWGEGNPLAPIFVILDNPGARETKSGDPFLCGTRQTLQQGALDASVNIENIYVSYLLKARPLGKYDKERAREQSLAFLLKQIEQHNPKIVFCLGTIVVQAYFTNPNASVKELRGTPHLVRGRKTIASYHPLAVRRRPVLYKYFVDDWTLVAAELVKEIEKEG